MSKPAPTRTIDTTIVAVEHDSTSAMGNPTYRIVTPVGYIRTQTNGSIGYGARNYQPRRHLGELDGRPVTLHVRTLRGEDRVVNITDRSDAAPVTYSRADIVNGTGFKPTQRFVAIPS